MARRTKKSRSARRTSASAIKRKAAAAARAKNVVVVNPQASFRNLTAPPKAVPARKGATAEPPPALVDSISLDDVDEAFFRRGEEIDAMPPEESLPPTSNDVEKDSIPPPPEVLARRSKFRKFVGLVVVLGVIVVLGGLGKAIARDYRPPSIPTSVNK